MRRFPAPPTDRCHAISRAVYIASRSRAGRATRPGIISTHPACRSELSVNPPQRYLKPTSAAVWPPTGNRGQTVLRCIQRGPRIADFFKLEDRLNLFGATGRLHQDETEDIPSTRNRCVL